MTKKPININMDSELPKSTKKKLYEPSAELIGQAFRGITHKVFGHLIEYNIVKDQELNDLKNKVQSKIDEIPEENRSTEKLGLTLKATEDSAYQLSSEELRELFANLIASSVDNRVNDELHPSFSSILKDLSPKDATILKKIYNNITVPSVTVRIEQDNGTGVDTIENIMLFDDEYVIHPKSLNNLERFGLITTSPKRYLSSEENTEKYNNFEQSDYYLQEKKKLPIRSDDLVFTNIKVKRGKVELTSFGESFGQMVIS